MTGIAGRLSAALAGRYDIERELGAGGMATVYLANDVRHDRKVALKVLRPDLAAVIGASRFLHEIRTTANLQHPHILPLHDSGEVEGTVFCVMPFVDGESLRDRLNREKQLPVDEAVRIAVEVAGALDYAHQHKVIHRDIKPENILLQGGHALVADFGIALAAVRSDGGARLTETGMSLGTPAYMSPEQSMGERELTARSDVYALGCVVYEMLTGEPPFTGPTAQAIVARVMTEEPRSLTLQRRTVPRHVEAAIHRALAKLPADRFPTAAAFAQALANPAAMDGLLSSPTSRNPVRRAPALIAGTLTIAALGAAFVAGRRTAPETRVPLVRFTVAKPDSLLDFGRCCGNGIALSPDGRTLVFSGFRSNGGGPLYRRSLGRLDAEPIPGTERASVPFFSPDGRWLGFFADGRLRKMAVTGGPSVPIAIPPAEVLREASWGDGDMIVFSAGNRLFTVAAAGGEPRPLALPDSQTQYYAPWFLPGGKAALFTIRPFGTGIEDALIGVVDLESGKVDTLGPGTKAAYGNGYLLYGGADNTLMAQRFDPRRRKALGQAIAVVEPVNLVASWLHQFAVSPAGALAYQPGPTDSAEGDVLRLVGANGRAAVELPGRSAENLEDPAFSPDGRKIALRLEGSGAPDVWILDRRQGTLDRLTVGGGSYPLWSPDGSRIAYAAPDGIYLKAADGTGAAAPLLKGAALVPGSWLPDGRTLVLQAGRNRTRSDIGLVTVGDTAPRWRLDTEFRERHPQVSPDGRWLAYASDRTGQFEVYVEPLAAEGPRVRVSAEGGEAPRWSPDGRTLYYVARGSIIAAGRGSGPRFEITGRKAVVQGIEIDLNATNPNWDIHPDGKEFLFIETAGRGPGSSLVWINNWTELVRQMAAK